MVLFAHTSKQHLNPIICCKMCKLKKSLLYIICNEREFISICI